FQGAGIGEIELGDFEAHRALAHTVEQAARAAVEIVHGDDVRATVETFERGGDGGNAGREREGRAAALQIGDAAFEGHARGILRARIVVALVYAGALLDVGGRGVDRHHHRAGGRIGLLARVHAARGKVELICFTHSRSPTR